MFDPAKAKDITDKPGLFNSRIAFGNNVIVELETEENKGIIQLLPRPGEVPPDLLTGRVISKGAKVEEIMLFDRLLFVPTAGGNPYKVNGKLYKRIPADQIFECIGRVSDEERKKLLDEFSVGRKLNMIGLA